MPEIKYKLETKFGSIYGQEELDALKECLERNAPSCDKKVLEFEKVFAEYCVTRGRFVCHNFIL